MRKGLALLVAVVMAAGIVVLWQPATATAAAPARRHPTARVCPDNGKLLVCFAIRQTDTVVPNLATNALPNGFGPADLRSAYGLTTTGSAAMTVAIVDAFDDPQAESDLATYRSTFSLPACTTANGCFRKVNQSGQASPLPRTDTGWAGEISLDLDMVSAICPDCHILLVEANNPSTTNLGTAVNTAANLGAKFVSNSYGGPENGFENNSDASYFNHPGVVITASTGDNGFGVSYPASGKGVTAVGGSSLTRDTSTRGWSETVWNGAGSGCSGSVAKPAFQVGLTTGCAKRAEADVAAVADPQTGVAVYQTFGASGWAVYGGTSAASPIIASVYALAGSPGATDSPNSYPYAHPGALNDVTTGNNGPCGAPLCTAGVGYDGPTGTRHATGLLGLLGARRIQHHAHLLGQPLHFRPASDIHRRRVLGRRHPDGQRDLQQRRQSAGHRRARQRSGHPDHLGAAGWHPHDHRELRRGREHRAQHRHPDPDGQRGGHHHHAHRVGQPVTTGPGGDIHGCSDLTSRHSDRHGDLRKRRQPAGHRRAHQRPRHAERLGAGHRQPHDRGHLHPRPELCHQRHHPGVHGRRSRRRDAQRQRAPDELHDRAAQSDL